MKKFHIPIIITVLTKYVVKVADKDVFSNYTAINDGQAFSLL